MDQDEILLDAEERMEKAVQVLHGQLQGLRTGRATSGLVDSIRVDYYGSPTPLKQIANISIPEPQQILIRPFDASTLTNIAKAIQSSDTGLSPNSDGRVIRLNVPALSTERRRQLSGRVKELAEEARVAIRNVRRDANKHADQGEKDKIPDRGRVRADEGADAGVDQEVRGQGQRHGRRQGKRSDERLTEEGEVGTRDWPCLC